MNEAPLYWPSTLQPQDYQGLLSALLSSTMPQRDLFGPQSLRRSHNLDYLINGPQKPYSVLRNMDEQMKMIREGRWDDYWRVVQGQARGLMDFFK